MASCKKKVSKIYVIGNRKELQRCILWMNHSKKSICMKYLYNTCKELGVFQIRIELIVYTVTTIKEQDFCFSHMRFEKIDTEGTLANRRL